MIQTRTFISHNSATVYDIWPKNFVQGHSPPFTKKGTLWIEVWARLDQGSREKICSEQVILDGLIRYFSAPREQDPNKIRIIKGIVSCY